MIHSGKIRQEQKSNLAESLNKALFLVTYECIGEVLRGAWRGSPCVTVATQLSRATVYIGWLGSDACLLSSANSPALTCQRAETLLRAWPAELLSCTLNLKKSAAKLSRQHTKIEFCAWKRNELKVWTHRPKIGKKFVIFWEDIRWIFIGDFCGKKPVFDTKIWPSVNWLQMFV